MNKKEVEETETTQGAVINTAVSWGRVFTVLMFMSSVLAEEPDKADDKAETETDVSYFKIIFFIAKNLSVFFIYYAFCFFFFPGHTTH